MVVASDAGAHLERFGHTAPWVRSVDLRLRFRKPGPLLGASHAHGVGCVEHVADAVALAGALQDSNVDPPAQVGGGAVDHLCRFAWGDDVVGGPPDEAFTEPGFAKRMCARCPNWAFLGGQQCEQAISDAPSSFKRCVFGPWPKRVFAPAVGQASPPPRCPHGSSVRQIPHA